jgi:hypothetical protein
MLYGMAIELMYKAILIAKGCKPKNFKTHILIDLAKWAGITVDVKSNLILQLLTESVIWADLPPENRSNI